MNGNDKTRQKLMESMRKTKAGVGKNAVAAESKDRGHIKKGETVKAKTKKAQKRVSVKKDAQSTSDLYQSGRRIWPD